MFVKIPKRIELEMCQKDIDTLIFHMYRITESWMDNSNASLFHDRGIIIDKQNLSMPSLSCSYYIHVPAE